MSSLAKISGVQAVVSTKKHSQLAAHHEIEDLEGKQERARESERERERARESESAQPIMQGFF